MSDLMANVDYLWLLMDQPTNMMVIGAVMEFETVLDFDSVRRTLENRFCIHDRFRKKVVPPISGVGSPTWELDPDFDIRSHFHRLALPNPGDKTVLQTMISDLASTPLDPSKPLWAAYLVENYGKGSVLFFKIHHCIADGIALVQVLLSMTDTRPDAPIPKAKPRKKRKYSPMLTFKPLLDTVKNAKSAAQKVSEKLLQETMQAIANPAYLVDIAKHTGSLTTDTATLLAKLLLMPADPQTCMKGQLGVRKNVAWSDPLPLEDIRQVGQAVEATINDVLVSCVTGALRSYLLQRNNRIGKLEVRVTMPHNIRKPGSELQLGNRFSLIFLNLPVYVDDPILRLKEIKRRMDYLKSAPDAVVGFHALNALGMSPGTIAQKAADYLMNKTSAIMSNVPGPKQTLYLAGSKIDNLMFWAPRIGRVGLGISICSYDGKVYLGLIGDEKLIPDPETILDNFMDEILHLIDFVNRTGKLDHDLLVLNDRCMEALSRSKSRSDNKGDTRAKIKSVTPKAAASEVPKHKTRCSALTKAGNQCKRQAADGLDVCTFHQKVEK